MITTNARLTKLEATFAAALASQALPSVVSPVGTKYDGDLVIVLSCGDAQSNPHWVGLTGQHVVRRAVLRAAEEATSLGEIPSMRDLASRRGDER